MKSKWEQLTVSERSRLLDKLGIDQLFAEYLWDNMPFTVKQDLYKAYINVPLDALRFKKIDPIDFKMSPEIESAMRKKIEEIKIRRRAEELFKKMKAECQYGGCDNHGQEFCNIDAAWDMATRTAEDEICEEERFK